MHHADGRRHVVWHPTDVTVLGEGWAETRAEALRKRGMAQQFAGRGGVRSTNLPASMSALALANAAGLLTSAEERERERKERIAEWKRGQAPSDGDGNAI